MDRRSWLWRRKSSEKSPSDSESSGSMSSHSERCSDDQEAMKGSPNNASPNHAQMLEVSSNIGDSEVHETAKSLTEKLSAALLNIRAKEELVKQHAKVAEEAVSGWEQAETEVSALKLQLEAANKKNSALEDRIEHLDDALKECVRQLRQAREEQEEKVHDAVISKTREWELEKLELEKQLVEFKAQLQTAKSEAAAAVDLGLQAKLDASKKENAALKVEIFSQSEDLRMLTLERELSNQAAETASKQHLESIKKVAKLEAECCRLRYRAHKTVPVNDHKPIANSIYVESVTDSQSDSGERLLCMENESGCSDSWASALIAELDQFKNDKASERNLTASVEIDLMDDFLEMERLVALPEADHISSSIELEADSERVDMRDSPLKAEALHQQLAELEEKIAKMGSEKAELEMALVDSRNQFETSCNQLGVAEDKLLELQRQLDLANESKQVATAEVVAVEAKRKALESQLESAELEVRKLYDKVCLLEGKVEGEKTLSAELKASVEAAEAAKRVSESQLDSAHLEVGSLREMVGLLESKVEEERASSTEFAASVQAVEAARRALESQLESAHLEVSKLREKVGSLEMKVQEERTKSAEFATKIEAVEATREALEFQIEMAHLEIGRLHNKVDLLEMQVSKEKELTAEFAAKCQKLESEISRIKREAELWQVTSFGDLKIKKEKELAVAAGKLAECQKTIASLGQQLKSLTALDDFMLEAEKLEPNECSPDLIFHSSSSSEKMHSYTLPSGKERGSPLSSVLSSSSTLPGFTSFLSRSRSSSCIENYFNFVEQAVCVCDRHRPHRNHDDALMFYQYMIIGGETIPPRFISSTPLLRTFRLFSSWHKLFFFLANSAFNPSIYTPNVKEAGTLITRRLKCKFPFMGLFRSAGKVYKPAPDVNLGPDSKESYLHANVKAPRVAGFLVKIFVWILESRIFGPIAVYILKKDNLIHKLVSFAVIQEPPLFTNTHNWEDIAEQNVNLVKHNLSPAERVREAMDCLPPCLESTLNSPGSSFKRWTIRDFSRAYRSGETTPLAVAKRFSVAVEESTDLQMAFFINYNARDILRQAEESTLRYKRGAPISVMDGVLVAIKDEIDCLPYTTTGGTKWLHKVRPCANDATCVKQLRSCGAIFVGKTNMHELGAGTSGINPHYGSTRNPYNINRVSGGSSSGSAAVVCAGLCPVALGVDGGGSVRMPAALCGVVGFKATSGRLSNSGTLPLNWTVGMPGILAATVEDALIVYAAISGNLSGHQAPLQPKLSFPLLTSTQSITNIKLAKYGEWFNDCTSEIRNCCDQALQMLCKHYGWKTLAVTVPEIEEMRLAHYITIGSECTASLAPHLEKLNFAEIGWDARIALRVYRSFSSKDYLNAQRIRNRQMYFHKKIFERADVIVTPTTGVTAYPLLSDALNSGELDYINGAALVRFSIAGNFLGLPTITTMVGYDKGGMPIGLQFIGRPWSEATLLHLAFAMEALCIGSYRKPKVFYDLLKKE
ncbi:uncharacterized protein LOC103701393 [Phoenix dactylifera]|uniref:Uncharacterized protein LOC103701393 n=1 Tax=Phoenix dactylifera TaxID=42345 RepID=A0A8B9B251_PHODC|nr:uncharacterized protein LOC103701393 [Phoenix dactylifera]